MKRVSKIKFNKKLIPIIFLLIMIIGISYATYRIRLETDGIYAGSDLKLKNTLLTPLEELDLRKEKRIVALGRTKDKNFNLDGVSKAYATNETYMLIEGTRDSSREREVEILLTQNNLSLYNLIYIDAYITNLDTNEEKTLVINSNLCYSSAIPRILEFNVDRGEGNFKYLLKIVFWENENDKDPFIIGSYLPQIKITVKSMSRETTSFENRKIDFTYYGVKSEGPVEINFINSNEMGRMEREYEADFSVGNTYFKDGTYDSSLKFGTFVSNPHIIYLSYYYNTDYENPQRIIFKKNLEGFFKDLSNLVTVNFNDVFYGLEVTSLKSLFEGCTSLTYVDLSNFDTTQTTDMSRMFYGCENLRYVKLGSFTNRKLVNVDNMFYGCTKLSSIFTKGFDITNIESNDVFTGCENLIGNNFTTIYNSSNVSSQYGDESHYFNRINDEDDGNLYSFLNTRTSYGKGNTDLVSWLTTAQFNKITDVYFVRMTEDELDDFDGLTTTIVNGLKMKVTGHDDNILIVASPGTTVLPQNLYGLFYSDYIENVYFDNINTKNSTGMDSLFSNSKITAVDLSKFDTSNVTTASNLFYNCQNLKVVNLSTISTKKIIYFTSMFDGCTDLEYLDLSKFDTSEALSLENMFRNCSSLRMVYNHFDTSKVTNFTNTFLGTNSMAEYNFGKWDFGHARSMKNFITRSAINTTVNGTTIVFENADLTMINDCTKVQDFINIDFSDVSKFVFRNVKLSNSITTFMNNGTVSDGTNNYLFGSKLIYIDMTNTSMPGVTSFQYIAYQPNLTSAELNGLRLDSTNIFRNIIVGDKTCTKYNYGNYFDLSNIYIPNATTIGNILEADFNYSRVYLGFKTNQNWTLVGKIINQTNKTKSLKQEICNLSLLDIDLSKCINGTNNFTDYFSVIINYSGYKPNRNYFGDNLKFTSAETCNSSNAADYYYTLRIENCNLGNIDNLILNQFVYTTSYNFALLINGTDMPYVEKIIFSGYQQENVLSTGTLKMNYISISNCDAPSLITLGTYTNNVESFDIHGLNAPNLTSNFNNYFSPNYIKNINFSYARLDSVQRIDSLVQRTGNYSSSNHLMVNFEGVYFASLTDASFMLTGVNFSYIQETTPTYNKGSTSYSDYMGYVNFKNAHLEGENFSLRGAFSKIGLNGNLNYVSFENMYVKGVSDMSYFINGVSTTTNTSKIYPLEFNLSNMTIIGSETEKLYMDSFADNITVQTLNLNNTSFTNVESAKYAFRHYTNNSSSTVYESNLLANNFSIEGDNYSAQALFSASTYHKYHIEINNAKILGASNLTSMLSYCIFDKPTNLSYIDYSNLNNLTSFLNGTTMNSYVVFNNIDWSNITDMSSFLANSSYDYAYVTDSHKNYTYQNKSIYLNGCNFENVTKFTSFFSSSNSNNTIKGITIDIDKTSLTDISSMFAGTVSKTYTIENINIENLDCNDVVDMRNLLYHTTGNVFSSANMQGLNKVEDMTSAFQESNFKEILLPNLTGENVKKMDDAFFGTGDLIRLDLGSFNPQTLVTCDYLFTTNNISFLDLSSLDQQLFVKMNLILPGRFNATVANGGYAAGKPYIIVKDTNVKNFLTSNNYFVADQLLVNGTTDIYFNPSTKFIDTNGTEIENRLVIPITTRGSRYNNQTITVTENNRNTSKVYMDRYEVDYKNKRIYIYMKTNKTEGYDTHTVSFTFGLDTNVTKTLELDYGYRT